MAIDTILDELKNGSGEPPPDPSGFRSKTSRLGAAVRRSNQSIYDAARKDERQARMGTTVVGAWIAEDIVSLAHVGDSRAYLWQRGHLEPLTSDHSLVEMQVKAGVLTRENSLQHQDQNVLLRALGREPDVDVELNEVPVQAGDYLLLCSDGLTRMVPELEMSSTIADIRDPQDICEELVAAANRNGGADNITVVVVEVIGGWWSELVNRVKRSLRRPRWRK
jgi:serine/threonine protein phosphatase PrpC